MTGGFQDSWQDFGDDKSRQGGSDDQSLRTPREIFPHWDEILDAVQKALVTAGENQDLASAEFATRFFEIVSKLVSQHPSWNVQNHETSTLSKLLRETLFGYGPLEPLMRIEGLEEIIANRFDDLWLIVLGQKRKVTQTIFRSEEELRNFVDRVMNAQGKELNLSNPADDGVLLDGSRIQVTIPPVALNGTLFSIRKFKPQAFTMREYLATGMFPMEFLIELRRWIDAQYTIVISGGTASGKAQPLDAKILTPTGWKLMGDLAMGDEVIGSDGHAQRVTGIFPQGDKQVWQVRLMDGAVVECCDEHLWAVQTREQHTRGEAGQVVDTRAIQQMFAADRRADERLYLPALAPVQYEPSADALPISPYLLGVALASGVTCLADLENLRSEVRHCALAELPVAAAPGGASSDPLAEALVQVGVALGDSEVYEIPAAYMTASEADRVALLQGLFDGASPDHLFTGRDSGWGQFPCPNARIARQVGELGRSLGARGGYSQQAVGLHRDGQTEPQRHYFTRLYLPSAIKRSRADEAIVQVKDPWLGRSIAEVTATDERKPMQCISVSNPDQLYVTDGFTLTHNTTFINAVGSLIPKDDRLLIMEDTPELKIKTEDTVNLKTIGGGARGQSASDRTITMRDLVRYALRLRPDRILIGEVRGVEAYDLLQALNTGHAGSFTTVHADAAILALSRLRDLAVSAEVLGEAAIESLLANAVDIVIQVARIPGQAARRVLEARQVFHPYQLTNEGKALLEPIAKAGDVQRMGSGAKPPICSFPLFEWNGEELIRRYDPIPMAGRVLGAREKYEADPFGDGMDAEGNPLPAPESGESDADDAS